MRVKPSLVIIIRIIDLRIISPDQSAFRTSFPNGVAHFAYSTGIQLH